MQLQSIQNKIYEIRGPNVMFDFDLAEMYKVETRSLKQAVRRNADRFPADFMFVLTENEIDTMVSQNVIPSRQQLGGARPFVFTEQGVAMLSSVLRSKIAIEINITIIRAFVFLMEHALTHRELTEKLAQIESRFERKFKDISEAINYLLQKDIKQKEQTERKPIGYKRK